MGVDKVMRPCSDLSTLLVVTPTEVPALGVFLGDILALGENEIERELSPRFLCDPTAVFLRVVRHEAFRELVPFTGTVTGATLTLAVPVYFLLKEVSLCPFVAWLGDVRGRCW